MLRDKDEKKYILKKIYSQASPNEQKKIFFANFCGSCLINEYREDVYSSLDCHEITLVD